MLTILSLAMLAQPMASSPPKIKQTFQTYEAASAEAARLGVPLVVFVSTAPRHVTGTLVTTKVTLAGVTGPAVVVALPNGRGWLYHHATLPGTSSDTEVRRAAGLEVSRVAVPFNRPGADGKADSRRERLAKRFPFLSTMERYDRAEYTQAIAVSNNRDSITPVPRTSLDAVWQVPGGLEGVQGWTSELYRFIAGGQTWVGNIGVLNSFGYIQQNRGWQRQYKDGTYFADLLSTDKGVFEIRVAEKNDGVWERYIAYKNGDARPEGYTGLRQACSACHSQAGTGGYSRGLVPGGDTVISDPFHAMENSGER